MRNYFKKFSIMFMMALAIIGIGMIYGGNGANAATVGQQLTSPEDGWKRIDEVDKNIIYNGTYDNSPQTGNSWGNYVRILKLNGGIKFKFYGTQFRLIGINDPNQQSSNIQVKIDGNPVDAFSQRKSPWQGYILSYESAELSNSVHEVTMTDLDSTHSISNFVVDAIDIKGNLLPYNESISLDKSTMNLTEGDSGQLIATTTPAAVGVTWTSSDPSIATIEVDPTNGKLIKVNAIKEGTCTITATTTDGNNLSASCTINITKKTEPIPTPDPQPTDTEYITNIAHAKGTNTNNPGGEVTIIFHGTADTILSIVKTADVKDVWVGDNFTYTLVITNTGTKTAKAVVVNDPAPNHIDFNVSGVTTTQGTVDSSSTTKNIIVNVGDILPGETVTIKIPSTVIA
ncbi:Ig-like domain-containing protein [Clostridium sp. YIM B02555]|uniref:Ig-like domain-containing protein n=1 Tax=Clostridium sp. YIM B02555 TaxID=2911968 RepID=UPI001EED5032|nr:Ig-like domain-containing protein [Clostridium sp. YIM B02555]